MLFLEDQARLLLVVHAVLGAATVATATHFVLWARTWTRGGGRDRGTRWFAVAAPALYVAQFALGNLIYPVYKVRVRAEYLDSPSAIAAEGEARRRAAEEIHARAGVAASAPEPLTAWRGAQVARLFDVKEHWAAIGLPLVLLAAALVFLWDPARDPSALARWLLLGAAGGAAATAWFAALVGVYVASIRAL